MILKLVGNTYTAIIHGVELLIVRLVRSRRARKEDTRTRGQYYQERDESLRMGALAATTARELVETPLR